MPPHHRLPKQVVELVTTAEGEWSGTHAYARHVSSWILQNAAVFTAVLQYYPGDDQAVSLEEYLIMSLEKIGFHVPGVSTRCVN